MRSIRLALVSLGVLGLVGLPFAAAAEEPEEETTATEEETADEGTMTAVDSTAKHLETLEERAAEAPEAAQPGLEHALEVSAHGHEVVTAVDEGLRGEELAEVASSMSEVDHGPPGSPGARTNSGRPANAGAPAGVPGGQP